MRSIVFRTSALATGCLVALAVASPAMAQTTTQGTTPEAATPTGAATPDTGAALSTEDTSNTGSREILVTGSRIKQDPNRSALPLEIITNDVIELFLDA